jgi:hypothetical protein
VEQSPSSCLLFPAECKAGLDGASGRPDEPVFPLVAAVRPGLHHRPFPDAADNRRAAESWLDAGHAAAHPVCLDRVGAIPEVLRGQRAVDAEKLAGREPLPAGAVPDHLAWVWIQARLASADGSAERWVRRRAAVVLCIPDADQFAA